MDIFLDLVIQEFHFRTRFLLLGGLLHDKVELRSERRGLMGSVVKKRRKRMAKKKHKKLLKKTRIQRRNKK
jgi:hypothetical protein